MPEDNNSQELADHFSNFFHTKIKKIVDVLKEKPDYCPKKCVVPRFVEFKQVSKKDVLEVITKLGLKQCELDVFPVKFIVNLKENFCYRL
jgi:Na+-translocating ferredoxin:NAD+ oxidoreductase RnfC subunit